MEKSTYATFFERLGAWVVDQIIFIPVYLLLLTVIRAAYPEMIQSEVEAITMLISIGAFWIYFATFNSSSWQATPGKRLFGLKVSDLSGNRISFARASKQHFGTILSTLTLFVGFVMIFWTKKKQGLHDIIADTIVIK